MSTVATLVVALQGNVRGFVRALDLAESRLAMFGRRGRASAAVTGLTVSFIAAGATVAAVSTKMAIDFESALAGVRKTVDSTDAQFAHLTESIEEMAKATGFSVIEIAGVAQAAGQVGVGIADLEAFTKVMLEVGTATNITAEDAAVAFARFMNVMQTSFDDVRDVADVVVELGNRTAGTEAEIVNMAQRMTGFASILGISEEGVLGLAAAMIDLGIPSELGGTAMQKFATTVQIAVADGGDDLAKFAAVAGMTTDDFATFFEKDALGALLAFINGLNTTKERGIDNIKVLKDLGLGNERNVRVLQTMAEGYQRVGRDIDIATDSQKTGGALADEFARRQETAAVKIRKAVRSVQEVMRDFGKAILPGVLHVLDRVGDWFEENGPRLRDMWNEAKPVVIVFGVALAVVGEGLLQVAEGLARAHLLLPVLTAGVIALTVAFLPIGLVGLKIMAIIAVIALVGYAVGRWGDEIKAVFSAVVGWIDKHWKAAAVILTLLMGPMGLVVVAVVKFRDKIADAFGWVKDRLVELKDNWREIMASLVMATQKAVNAIIGLFTDMMNKGATAFNWVKNLGPGAPGFDLPDAKTDWSPTTVDWSGLAEEIRTGGQKGFFSGLGPALQNFIDFVEGEMIKQDNAFTPPAINWDDWDLEGLGFDADKAAEKLTELQKAIESFNERRANELVEAFFRDGPAGVAKQRAIHSRLDAEWLRTLELAERYGIEISMLHRDMFDRIKTETEQAVNGNMTGLLAQLMLRRAAMGQAEGELLFHTPNGRGTTNPTVVIENLTIGANEAMNPALLAAGFEQGVRQTFKDVRE